LAAPGGRHIGFGTRNALVGLGERIYLEIVGIDSEQELPAGKRLFTLEKTSTPRFAAWCARASRPLEETVVLARQAGYDPGEIIPMSRTRPDGTGLSWTLTSPSTDREGGVLPFYIDWGTTPHPASSLPSVLSLVTLSVTHPDPDRIRAILDALSEYNVGVEAGPQPALTVALRSRSV
jgi:hypothetical protein